MEAVAARAAEAAAKVRAVGRARPATTAVAGAKTRRLAVVRLPQAVPVEGARASS